MFSNNLKRPALALAVTAGLLAAAGPASAGTTNEPKGGAPTTTGSWVMDMGAMETLDLVAGPASAQAYSSLPEVDANANFFEEAAYAKEPLSFGLSFEHVDF